MDASVSVLVTTHGYIPVKDGKPGTFRVPAGVTITKLSPTVPGVCAITTGPQISELVRFLRVVAKTDARLHAPTIVRSIEYLQESVRGVVKDDLKREEDEQRVEFLRKSGYGVFLETYSAGETMLDKKYARYPEEGLGEAFDYKFIDLGSPDKRDLFQLIKTGHSGVVTREGEDSASGKIMTSELVAWLAERGARTIYLYDLSCSTMIDEANDDYISERDVRALRSDLLKKKLFGGKPRKTRRKRTNVKRKERHYNGVSKARTRKVSRRQ